jgi:hypothetical protein
MQAPNYKAINLYAAHRDAARTAPTQPPPPDAADHIMQRVRQRRALAAQLEQEAAELERAAELLRGHHQ